MWKKFKLLVIDYIVSLLFTGNQFQLTELDLLYPKNTQTKQLLNIFSRLMSGYVDRENQENLLQTLYNCIESKMLTKHREDDWKKSTFFADEEYSLRHPSISRNIETKKVSYTGIVPDFDEGGLDKYLKSKYTEEIYIIRGESLYVSSIYPDVIEEEIQFIPCYCEISNKTSSVDGEMFIYTEQSMLDIPGVKWNTRICKDNDIINSIKDYKLRPYKKRNKKKKVERN